MLSDRLFRKGQVTFLLGSNVYNTILADNSDDDVLICFIFSLSTVKVIQIPVGGFSSGRNRLEMDTKNTTNHKEVSHKYDL